MAGSGRLRQVQAMRYAILSLAGLLLAAPAHATGGFVCSTASEPKIEISVGFGHVPGAPIFGERLTVGGEDIPVEAPQWWLDGEELRLLLTDEQANEQVALVHARWNDATHTFDGTVEYRGRTSWVRCYEG
ncbi:hypothetical protein [Alteriqipengyuania sp.]|uniref:hypothetical protein n=1 Tax=Alteriqipengyuania sp. TaxID=2800692 RepID=UPI003511EC28